MNFYFKTQKPFAIALLAAISLISLASPAHAVPKNIRLPKDIRATAESLRSFDYSIFKKTVPSGQAEPYEQYMILVGDDDLGVMLSQAMGNVAQGVADGLANAIGKLFGSKPVPKKSLIIPAQALRMPHTKNASVAALTADAAVILGGLAVLRYAPSLPFGPLNWIIPNPIRVAGALLVVTGAFDAIFSQYAYKADLMPKHILYLPGTNITSRSSAYQVSQEIHRLMDRKTPVRIVIQVEKHHAEYLLPYLEENSEYELLYSHEGEHSTTEQ